MCSPKDAMKRSTGQDVIVDALRLGRGLSDSFGDDNAMQMPKGEQDFGWRNDKRGNRLLKSSLRGKAIVCLIAALAVVLGTMMIDSRSRIGNGHPVVGGLEERIRPLQSERKKYSNNKSSHPLAIQSLPVVWRVAKPLILEVGGAILLHAVGINVVGKAATILLATTKRSKVLHHLTKLKNGKDAMKNAFNISKSTQKTLKTWYKNKCRIRVAEDAADYIDEKCNEETSSPFRRKILD